MCFVERLFVTLQVSGVIPVSLSAFFGSALNCLVHVVMYSYYGLSAVPALKNKLWWKHYITRFQLVRQTQENVGKTNVLFSTRLSMILC